MFCATKMGYKRKKWLKISHSEQYLTRLDTSVRSKLKKTNKEENLSVYNKVNYAFITVLAGE